MQLIYLITIVIIGCLALYAYHRQNLRLQQERGKARMQEQSARSLRIKLEKKEQQLAAIQAQLTEFEQESNQSKALFTTTSNIAYDNVFVLNENKVVIAYNRSASSLIGDKNPIGETLHDTLDAPELENVVERALSEVETLEEQFTIDRRYYRARTQVLHYSDAAYFIGIAIQDITQLVRLNRARRDMVANISHELRTPITKIRFVIDSLFYDQDRPKRKASIVSLREISQEVGELEGIVQALLDLSMIESGQSIMKLVPEPIVTIVDSAVNRLQEKLDEKEIKVVKHIPEKMQVLCERDHIIRVVVNLVSNAIKWSPEKDVITISATNGGEEVTITVFDNGPGVPDDQRERIFERFYQVDTARSGKEGSGLGLAICKHIVEAHGGRIWAQGNSQGNGGRFQFTVLNAEPNVDTDVYMDRGQHDALFLSRAPSEASAETELEDEQVSKRS